MKDVRMPRRGFLMAGGLVLAPALGLAQGGKVFAEIWKDEGCGCCEDWARHLEANGFRVKLHDGGHGAMRAKLGVGDRWASCHTALVGGYAIEGHVPAREIHRLLKEKPQALGLSVPGMPVGAPGMDAAAYGGRSDAFQVMLLARDGSARVYQAYPGTRV